MPKRMYMLVLSLLTVSVIFILHYWGLYNRAYWEFAWLDTMVHFLGGVWVASTLLYVFPKTPTLFVLIFLVLAIGVAWEIFELFIKSTSLALERYVEDTLTDLIADIGGGLFIALLYKRIKF